MCIKYKQYIFLFIIIFGIFSKTITTFYKIFHHESHIVAVDDVKYAQVLFLIFVRCLLSL